MGKNDGVILAAYLLGSIGLILILGITVYVVKKRRNKRVKKYIKEQSNRSIAMGPKLTSEPPRFTAYRWSDVKKGIKARRQNNMALVDEEEAEYDDEEGIDNPNLDTIREGEITSNPDVVDTVTRPQSARKTKRPRSAHTLKNRRLQIRMEAKRAKQIRKTRQKEVKHILTQMLEGQELPGDQFPGYGATSPAVNTSQSVTQVAALRRESIMAVPDTDYYIERSTANNRQVTRPTRQKKPASLPEGLYKLGGDRSSASNLSTRSSQIPRNVECEVTVHGDFLDYGSDVEDLRGSGSRATTEL